MGVRAAIVRMLNKNAQARPRAGIDYTAGRALVQVDRTATVFACMDRIATEFANLNFAIYDKRTRKKAARHRLLTVLHEPNSEERRFNFFYQSAIDYLNGGCYWLKGMAAGEVWNLYRLNRWQINVTRDPITNEKVYNYNGKAYKAQDVVYIPSRFDYSTLTGGASVFDAAGEAFDTMRQLEKFTQSSFSNGIVGERIVIDVQKAFPNITAEQAEALRNEFMAQNAGVENTGKPILKKKGIEFSAVGKSTDNHAVELTENRKFQEHEIAKVFGIPEQLLSAAGGKDGVSNLEDAFLLFNEFAIRPLAAQFQDAINALLDEARYYFEFDYNGVLKVSFEKRIDAYAKQITNGLLSPNEARAKENMDAIEAGDNFFLPVNLMPLNNDTVAAYMAKQKNELANGKGGFGQAAHEVTDPTDPDAQHSAAGDDKQ